MKVFEILKNDTPVPSAKELKNFLSKMDWQYEFSDDSRVITRGAKQMDLAENMLYALYKKDSKKALQIWSECCPWADKLEEGQDPDFITRFKLLEGVE